MNSCDSLWDLLSAYADEMVTPEEAARVERHIAVCADCARDLEFMRQTAFVLAETPQVEPPIGLQMAILAATIYRPTWRQRLQTALRAILTPPVLGRTLAVTAAAAVISGVLLTQIRPPFATTSSAPRATSALPRIAMAGRASSPGTPAPSVSKRPFERTALAPGEMDVQKPEPTETPFVPAVHREVSGKSSLRVGALERVPLHRMPSLNNGKKSGGEKPALRTQPEKMEPMPAEMKTPESQPEEKMTPERMMMSEMPTKSADMKPVAVLPASASASEGLHIRLIAASVPNNGAVASLADLRRTLRRDNESITTNSALYNFNDRREMTLAVLKTRF